MYLAIAGLFIFIFSFGCAFLLLTSRPLNRVKVLWMMFCVFGGLWGVGLYIAYSAAFGDHAQAMFGLQFANVFAMFIPLVMLHFAYAFCGRLKERKKELWGTYLFIAVLFVSVLVWPKAFIIRLRSILEFENYPVPGPLFHLFTVFFVYAFSRGAFCIYQEFKNSLALRRQQIKYFFLGFVFMVGGGGMTLLPVYGIPVEPTGILGCPFFISLTTLVLSQYYLIDVRLFILRMFLLTVTWVVALLTPYFAGEAFAESFQSWLGMGWWLVPAAIACVSTFLAVQIMRRIMLIGSETGPKGSVTLGQKVLLKISYGLARNRELDRLCRFIVRFLVWGLQVEHAFMYMYDREAHGFFLKSWHRRDRSKGSPTTSMLYDSSLINHVNSIRRALVLEETKLRARDENSITLELISREMVDHEADVILSCRAQGRMIALIVLGPRIGRQKAMTPQDIVFFSSMSGQIALALDNAMSFQDLIMAQEHLVESEKMVTIGTLVGGLSHQLNNRFTSLLFQSKSLSQLLGELQDPAALVETREKANELIGKIEQNVASSRDVVQGILGYSVETDAWKPFDIRNLIESSLGMAGFKVKLSDIDVRFEIDEGIPQIVGNFAQLQEVLFNIIDNAYHSMMEKKKLGLGAEFEPCLTFRARVNGSMVMISISDNGMGVKPENLRKIFTPFFSTKVLDKKGYGLGLYVIKQIVEKNHHGRIVLRSEYLKGASMEVSIPVQQSVVSPS